MFWKKISSSNNVITDFKIHTIPGLAYGFEKLYQEGLAPRMGFKVLKGEPRSSSITIVLYELKHFFKVH